MRIGRKSNIFKINGKAMISPQSFTVQFDNLADANSGRTDDGVMHISWIWRNIRKVQITLPPLSQKEIGEVLSLVQGQEYDLTYLDPIHGIHTIHCYTSNSSRNANPGCSTGGCGWERPSTP